MINEELNTIHEDVPLEAVDADDIVINLDDVQTGLDTLKEELKMKWNLAQMEGRDVKTELLEELDVLRAKVKENQIRWNGRKNEIDLQLHLGFRDAMDHWDHLNEVAHKALDEADHKIHDIAHLLDKGYTKTKEVDLKEAYQDAKRQVNHEVAATALKMRMGVKNFLQRIQDKL